MQTRSSSSTDRAAFMARISAALGRSHSAPPAEPAPDVDETIARLAQPGDDLAAMFAQRAEAVGMHVHRVAASKLADRAAALLAELSAKRIVVALGELPQADAIVAAVRKSNIECLDWRGPGGFDAQYDVDAGVTDVHAALAESGTLVCNSDAEHGRAQSLLPPVHVAVVRASDILPDMIDYWRRLGDRSGADLPSGMTFITGPSKTADIEGELVTGVHGPERVDILLVDDA